MSIMLEATQRQRRQDIHTRSATKPPEPFSVKIPTAVVVFEFVALGMLKTKFSNEVACDTCQWMPVGTSGWSLSAVDRGISVKSNMKLRI